jgi:hypothetical protein
VLFTPSCCRSLDGCVVRDGTHCSGSLHVLS